MGRCQSQGDRHHLAAHRAEGRHQCRLLPRPHLPRYGPIGQPRHRRAIRDPAAAERERKLGQGGAARAGAHRVRSGSGSRTAAGRHERHGRYRHWAAAQLCGAARAHMWRAMVTVCAMSATIMQALDTTIANVALPYMQGSLSASLDQINWVLTSYIVASAIMTAPTGWVADRFGRKRVFIIFAAGFTVASIL